MKIIAVVMTVGVVTDLKMTFTGDLFEIARQNNDFVIKVSRPQTKLGYGPHETSVSDPEPSGLSCFTDFC